jgi:hypothetical protein
MVQSIGSGGGRDVYDSAAMRDFVGIDLGREPVPDVHLKAQLSQCPETRIEETGPLERMTAHMGIFEVKSQV